MLNLALGNNPLRTYREAKNIGGDHYRKGRRIAIKKTRDRVHKKCWDLYITSFTVSKLFNLEII